MEYFFIEFWELRETPMGVLKIYLPDQETLPKGLFGPFLRRDSEQEPFEHPFFYHHIFFSQLLTLII